MDQPGSSPLVMVVESDGARREVAEALLASSHFAVAPVESVDGALAVCRTLAPEVIVCHEADEGRMRAGLLPLVIPIVATDAAPETIEAIVERVRTAIRGRV